LTRIVVASIVGGVHESGTGNSSSDASHRGGCHCTARSPHVLAGCQELSNHRRAGGTNL